MSNVPVFRQTPGVVLRPDTHLKMQKGINRIVDAIRPTLGPYPRIVAIENHPRDRSPELLDNGALIARRIIDLPDPDENIGAMYLRGMLWRLHEKVGDGTATAAVLFQSVYDEGIRFIAAGGNAMLLRAHLEAGMQAIIDTLSEMTIVVEGEEQLAGVADSVCYDPPLAKMMGEIFDIVGEYGWLDIRAGRSRKLEREYVEGSYWRGGVLSRELIDDRIKQKTQMENAAILITDLVIEDPQQLVPVLQTAVRAEIGSLFIVANKLANNVIGLLVRSHDSEKLRITGAKTPGAQATDQLAALEDLSALTGGRPVLKATGETLASLRPEDFGYARRIWADKNYLGLTGGKGDPRKLREHIATLRRSFELAEDTRERTKIRERIGKLMGGSAILWVGGATEAEVNTRKELAQRTASALRGAVREGVLYGGGVSLLACRPLLQQMLDQSASPEERAAYSILLTAVEAPFRALVSNAGHEASAIMSRVDLAGPGYGFDVTRECVAEMSEVSIYDVAAAQKSAVRSAISGAALALTVDIAIHQRTPPVAMQPD